MNWQEMTPRERDALVAEQVFGWKIYREHTWEWPLLFHETQPGITEPLPHYSESMDMAWLIIKKFSDEQMHRQFQEKFMDAFPKDDITCDDWDERGLTFLGLARLTPEKICLAALKAIGVK